MHKLGTNYYCNHAPFQKHRKHACYDMDARKTIQDTVNVQKPLQCLVLYALGVEDASNRQQP